MLVTSCRDNICRLWVETVLPEDGLVDLQQLDPAAAHNPMFHTHRHKKRFLQRLHHMRLEPSFSFLSLGFGTSPLQEPHVQTQEHDIRGHERRPECA
jgi:hypothetical protein